MNLLFLYNWGQELLVILLICLNIIKYVKFKYIILSYNNYNRNICSYNYYSNIFRLKMNKIIIILHIYNIYIYMPNDSKL